MLKGFPHHYMYRKGFLLCAEVRNIRNILLNQTLDCSPNLGFILGSMSRLSLTSIPLPKQNRVMNFHLSLSLKNSSLFLGMVPLCENTCYLSMDGEEMRLVHEGFFTVKKLHMDFQKLGDKGNQIPTKAAKCLGFDLN